MHRLFNRGMARFCREKWRAWRWVMRGCEPLNVKYIFQSTKSEKPSFYGTISCVSQSTVIALCFAAVSTEFWVVFFVSGDGRQQARDYNWYQSLVPAVDTRPRDRCCVHGLTEAPFVLATTGKWRLERFEQRCQ